MNHYQISIALLCAIFMITIPTTTIFLNYAGIFFLTDAHGQENSTAILKDIQTMLNKQTSISKRFNIPKQIGESRSIYYVECILLGISLVLFGLRMTMKAGQNFGKYFDLMILALTVYSSCAGCYLQIGIALIIESCSTTTDEPYLPISFLLYIPIGIILFLLVSHKMRKLPQV